MRVPTYAAVRSFAVLPPHTAAQITQALGEPGVSWESVVAERRAGRSTFPSVVFAAWDVSDIHCWAASASKNSNKPSDYDGLNHV